MHYAMLHFGILSTHYIISLKIHYFRLSWPNSVRLISNTATTHFCTNSRHTRTLHKKKHSAHCSTSHLTFSYSLSLSSSLLSYGIFFSMSTGYPHVPLLVARPMTGHQRRISLVHQLLAFYFIAHIPDGK